MASAPFSRAAKKLSMFPAGASNSGVFIVFRYYPIPVPVFPDPRAK
jgi:hypothetical protein